MRAVAAVAEFGSGRHDRRQDRRRRASVKTSSAVSGRSASRPLQQLREFAHCTSRAMRAPCPIRCDVDRAAPRSACRGRFLHELREFGRLIEVERDRVIAERRSDSSLARARQRGAERSCQGRISRGTRSAGEHTNRVGAKLVPSRRDGECRRRRVCRQKIATSAVATRGMSPGMVNMADPLAASRCAAAVTAPV